MVRNYKPQRLKPYKKQIRKFCSLKVNTSYPCRRINFPNYWNNRWMDNIKLQGPKNVQAGFKKRGTVPVNSIPVSRMLPAVPSPGDAEKLYESLISLLCDARYGTTKTSASRKKKIKHPSSTREKRFRGHKYYFGGFWTANVENDEMIYPFLRLSYDKKYPIEHVYVSKLLSSLRYILNFFLCL